MEPVTSSVTSKYQATIPKKIRQELGIQPGEEVMWHVLRGVVVLDARKKVRCPVRFLTSQIRDTTNAVRLVRRIRNEIA